jgi:hypothetical protein
MCRVRKSSAFIGFGWNNLLEVDKNLKKILLEKMSNFHSSMPVYSIKKLSYKEMIGNSKYYALQFTGKISDTSFRTSIRKDDLTIVRLSLDTKMRIYHNSNNILINRKMGLFENLIEKELGREQLSKIVINEKNRLQLDKFKMSFENVEFERLWQIKASSMTIEKTTAPTVTCRIVGGFRRYINEFPVHGGASIFIKMAGRRLIQSVGVDWRQIGEKPVNIVRIIAPAIAAERILKELNSRLRGAVLTMDDYEPKLFSLGYYSMPKRHQQDYMQPVYVATFESVTGKTLNASLVIPASPHTYEPVTVPLQPMSKV